MITCMSGLISSFLPAILGRHLPIVIGILSVPLALADVDIKDHIKSSFLWVWGFSFICMIVAIAFGIIPF